MKQRVGYPNTRCSERREVVRMWGMLKKSGPSCESRRAKWDAIRGMHHIGSLFEPVSADSMLRRLRLSIWDYVSNGPVVSYILLLFLRAISSSKLRPLKSIVFYAYVLVSEFV